MPMTPGTRMGPYEILSSIGAGGMGEVYRARDARLGRDVAIKVLPASFAADGDRLGRFEQEARAIGALNHPNILGVYDIGTHDGAPYVVSELLDGETLRARIGTSPLPHRKAIDYAGQIASGLAAAHDKGIVHRDLKPDNIFVTRDGRVKILDFGLAKLTAAGAPLEAETALLAHARPLTSAGTVLGTVGYMSPEQVRGQAVDHRSDIFSFGVVLYEMLTGRRAFEGDSAVETMNAILKEDPAPAAEGGQPLPPALDRIVLHCLEKNPEERFQSARDVAFDIQSLSGLSSQSVTDAPPPGRRRWLRLAAAATVLVAAGAALFLAGRSTSRTTTASFEPLTFRRGSVTFARFAPDGRTIIYAANFEGGPLEIYSTQPGSPESRPLKLEADLQAVSRHGEMAILLERPGKDPVLARLPIGGGAPREVLENVRSADWSPDGESLAVVRTEGGRDTLEFPIGRVLYRAHGWLSDVNVSPKGDRVAFFEHPVAIDSRGDVAVVESRRDEDDNLDGLGGSLRGALDAGRRRGVVQRVGRRRQDRRHRPCGVRRNAVRARAHGDERAGEHRTRRHRAGRARAAGTRQPPAVDHGARAGGGRGKRAHVDGLLVGRRHCGRRPAGPVRRAGGGRRPGLRRVPARHGPVAGRASRQGPGAIALP